LPWIGDVAMDLSYDRQGSGQTLVLLHPLGADRQMWKPVMAALADHRDVIAPDLPGFGGSPALPDGQEPSPRGLAAAISDFVNGLGVQDFHVAGNSLGGWVALEVALSGRARSVTALSPAGLWPEPLMPKRAVARALARTVLPAVGILVGHPGTRRLMLAGSVARPELVSPAAAALVRAYATAPGFPDTNALMRAGRFQGLERIRVPVTLAWGERDRLVAAPAHMPQNVRSVILRGCGHIPTWDDPRAVTRVLLQGSAVAPTPGGRTRATSSSSGA